MENNEARSILQLRTENGMMRWSERVAGAILAAAAFILFAGGIADSLRSTHADTEVQISANFGNGSLMLQDGACAESANQPSYDATNNTLNMSGIAGSIISNCVQFTAGTTGPQGYTIMIDGPDSGKLTLANVSINNKDGSMASPTVFAAQTTAGVWGFGIPRGQVKGVATGFDTAYNILPGDNTVNTAKYAPVPTAATPFSYTQAANVAPDIYDIYFGAHLGSYAPTGNYTGVVTVSIVGNAAVPPTPVITRTANSIPAAYGTTSGTVTAVTDINATCKWNRGADFTYATQGVAFTATGGTSHSTTVTGLASGMNIIYVRCANTTETSIVSEVGTTSATISTTIPPGTTGSDIQTVKAFNCPTTRTRVRDARDDVTYWIRKIDNLCWMETNLAYAGGGINTYGDVTPAMTRGSTNSYNSTYYDIPTGSNRTTGATNPSASTDGGATNPQYGYLYNWCAALNGQYEACQGIGTIQPNQGVNGGVGALYNICPLGWRLPTGGYGGEFASLNTVINNGSITDPSGLLANGLYMYGGLWNDGYFGNQGFFGYYWSSLAHSSGGNSAFSLLLTSSNMNVAPANYNNKRYGYAIRCVAE
jgi:uncharacterized protein (TIGR02145 family)